MDGTAGNNNWYRSDVTVALSATDNVGGSGVAKTEYSMDGLNWTTYTNAFTITTEGTTTIYYRSTDKAGNIEATQTYIVKIDKTPPELAVGFEPVSKGFAIKTVDSVSGPQTETIIINPYTHGKAKEQTFVLKDKADNTLEVTVVATSDGDESKLQINKLVYNGAVLPVAKNTVKVEYNVKNIEQQLQVTKKLQKNEWEDKKNSEQELEATEKMEVEAKYNAKKDQTFVHGTGIPSTEKKGLFILWLKSNVGQLSYEG